MARLRESGVATDADVAELDAAVSDEINLAVSFAEAGTWEPVEDLLKDVYTPIAPGHAVSHGAA